MSPQDADERRAWIFGFVEQFGSQLLTLITTIILARVLVPDDFGLIATASIALIICQQLIDGGTFQYIIQKKDTDDKDLSTLFWACVLLSVICFIALTLSSFYIAEKLRNPDLVIIIILISFTLIPQNLCRVSEAILSRNLEFQALSSLRLVSILTGCITGLTAAALVQDYRALIAQQVTTSVILCLTTIWKYPWRPRQFISWNRIKVMYSTGSPIMIAGGLRSLSGNFCGILIALLSGPTAMGLYDRGKLIPERLGHTLSKALSRNNFALWAKRQDDSHTLERLFHRSLHFTIGISLIATGSIIIYADEVILLLFGEKWIESTIYLQLTGLYFLPYPVWSVCTDLLRAKGYVNFVLRLSIISSLLELGCATILYFLSESITTALFGMFIGHTIAIGYTLKNTVTKLNLSGRKTLTHATSAIIIPCMSIILGQLASTAISNTQTPLMSVIPFLVSLGLLPLILHKHFKQG